ncbi:hypothetical protein Tco_0554997, partial [Tanacetum coccineum]
MKEKKYDEGTKKAGNTSVMMKGQESANLINKELMTTKPTDFGKIGEILGLSIQDGEE